MSDISDEQYREAAKAQHECEGTCEIDSNAVVSRGGDPGAYVQAWVWVYNDTIPGYVDDEESLLVT